MPRIFRSFATYVAALIGIAGVLWAFAYLRTVEPAGFNLDRSFQILFIIIIGGLASLRGAFLGAAFIVVFPLLLSRAGAALLGVLVVALGAGVAGAFALSKLTSSFATPAGCAVVRSSSTESSVRCHSSELRPPRSTR